MLFYCTDVSAIALIQNLKSILFCCVSSELMHATIYIYIVSVRAMYSANIRYFRDVSLKVKWDSLPIICKSTKIK